MAIETLVDERVVSKAVQLITNHLIDFDDETRIRVFKAAQTILGLDALPNTHRSSVSQGISSSSDARTFKFSAHEELSPKEFIFQKQPKTDVERVTCLAYYLSHFRDTSNFKTMDISKLNTEAAHAKFSNAASAVANAASAGLIVSAGKGAKQISASGERYVDALPDRSAAKEVKSSIKPRRARKKSNGKQKKPN